MKIHTIYVDGGAYNNGRSNQQARICVVYENEVVIHENIGNHTNNEAEFISIEKALEWINKYIDTKESIVTIFSDSKLAVNMVNYIWQGKLIRLKELRDRIADKIPNNTSIKWAYRDFNKAGQVLEFHLKKEIKL